MRRWRLDRIQRAPDAWAKGPDVTECRRRFRNLTPCNGQTVRDVVAGHLKVIIAHRHDPVPKAVEFHRARVEAILRSDADLYRGARA